MNKYPMPKNPSNQKTARTLQIVRLVGRSLHVLFRKVFPSRRWSPRSEYQLMEMTPVSLLRECVRDLHTAFRRMGRRVDALPFPWTSPFGGSVIDANGYLRPNTRTLGCMKDMQRLEGDFPISTNFDWEMFRIGWEAGAKWGENNSCKTEPLENPYNPPENNRIQGSRV